mgnify:CR=1 FL=1
MEDRNGIILWELMMVRQKESISIVCYLHEQGEKFKFAGKNDELYVYWTYQYVNKPALGARLFSDSERLSGSYLSDK